MHYLNIFILKESERKAYNPRSFCKTYTMDKQPLNTGEQKDMTEFFTDLISKLEEMSSDMVCIVGLFCQKMATILGICRKRAKRKILSVKSTLKEFL